MKATAVAQGERRLSRTGSLEVVRYVWGCLEVEMGQMLEHLVLSF